MVAGGNGRRWLVLANGRQVLLPTLSFGVDSAKWYDEDVAYRSTVARLTGLTADDVTSLTNTINGGGDSSSLAYDAD